MRCPACGNILDFDWCDECCATLEAIIAELEEDGDDGGMYEEDEEDYEDDEGEYA